jgi:hypothetical protein
MQIFMIFSIFNFLKSGLKEKFVILIPFPSLTRNRTNSCCGSRYSLFMETYIKYHSYYKKLNDYFFKKIIKILLWEPVHWLWQRKALKGKTQKALIPKLFIPKVLFF